MSTAPELSIVLPVYNEGRNIAKVLTRIADDVRTPHEVIIVYDFDEDDTLPVVRAMQASMPTIRLQRNRYGSGVLTAMRSGIAAAAANYVLIAMADGSDDMKTVDEMIGLARSGADVVAASRYMPGGAQVGGPKAKSILSRIAGLTLHLIGGLPIRDPTSNFKLYSRRFLDATAIESRSGFELALELSVKAYLSGHRLAETPTIWRGREFGESRFQLLKWLPQYLRWYAHGIVGRIRARSRSED